MLCYRALFIMSKYIDEIIKDIKANPETYKDYAGRGLEKGNISISGFGNTKLLSIIHVYIKSKDMPTSYIDLWRLETVIKWWYRNCNLDIIRA